MTVSRRIGHASPVVTLSIYSYLFKETDKTAAGAIEGRSENGRGTVIRISGANPVLVQASVP